MGAVTIRTNRGTTTVEALPCGVPGLVIHRAILIDGTMSEGLTLTHVRSGLSVGYFPPGTDPEAVLACAQELAPLADWTLPGNQIGGLDRDAVIAITRRWGAEPAGILAESHEDVGVAS